MSIQHTYSLSYHCNVSSQQSREMCSACVCCLWVTHIAFLTWNSFFQLFSHCIEGWPVGPVGLCLVFQFVLGKHSLRNTTSFLPLRSHYSAWCMLFCASPVSTSLYVRGGGCKVSRTHRATTATCVGNMLPVSIADWLSHHLLAWPNRLCRIAHMTACLACWPRLFHPPSLSRS